LAGSTPARRMLRNPQVTATLSSKVITVPGRERPPLLHVDDLTGAPRPADRLQPASSFQDVRRSRPQDGRWRGHATNAPGRVPALSHQRCQPLAHLLALRVPVDAVRVASGCWRCPRRMSRGCAAIFNVAGYLTGAP